MLEKIKKFLSEKNTEKGVIIKNTLIFGFGEILLKIVTFFTFVIVGRKLGLEDFGDLNFLMTFVGFFIVFSDFGTNTLLFKEIADPKTKNIINDILNVKKILLIIAIILCISIYIFTGFTISLDLLFLTLLYLLVKYVGDSCKTFYRGSSSFGREFQLKMIELFIGILIIFTFFFIDILTLNTILIVYFFSQCIITFWYLNSVNRDFGMNFLGFSFDSSFMVIVKRGFFYGGSGLLATINFSFDQILLKYFGFTEELGLYAGSFRLISIGLMVISYIFIPIFPNLIKNYSSNNYKYLKMFNFRSFQFILLFGALTIPIAYFCSEFILILLFGEKFVNGGIYLFILYVSFILIFLREPAGYTLTAINKPNITFIILSIACIMNIVTNLLFIPLYGALGASLTTLFTELITLIGYLFYVRKFITNEK